jgi:CTP synthase (UTP-ammonia lyase)
VIRIGVVGDFHPASPSHPPTTVALSHAAAALGLEVESCWQPTPELDAAGAERLLEGFSGLWIASGSPYRSLAGALRAIRFARERGRPLVAT